MILALESVSKAFAGLQALAEVSFAVAPGAITAVIGPNGAGKTTLFNVVTGGFPPTRGSIRFLGRDIAGLPPERIVGLGIARTFQHVHLFRTLTVLENVMLARHGHSRAEALACGLGLPWARREEAAVRAQALEYLDLLGLAGERDRIAPELPLGRQRYVELARALATEPRLILLDEPTAGLNEREAHEFGEALARELPGEWPCGALIPGLEVDQALAYRLQGGEVVGGEHLSLDDGEVDLNLVEPTGVDW